MSRPSSLPLLLLLLYYPFWIVPVLVLERVSMALWFAFVSILGVPILLILRSLLQRLQTRTVVSAREQFRDLARNILRTKSASPFNILIVFRWFAEGRFVPNYLRRLGRGIEPLRYCAKKVTSFMSPVYKWIDEGLSTEVERGFIRIPRDQVYRDSPEVRETRERTRRRAYLQMERWFIAQLYACFYPLTLLTVSIATSLIEGQTSLLATSLLDDRTQLVLYAFWAFVAASAVLIPSFLTSGLKERHDYLVEVYSYFRRRLRER